MKTRKAVFLLTLTTLFAGASTAFAQGVQNRGAEARGGALAKIAQQWRIGPGGHECNGTGSGECVPRMDGSGRVEKERPGNRNGNGIPRRDGSGGGKGNGRGKGNGGDCPNG